MRRNSDVRLRDGGTVLLEFLAGLVIIVSAGPLNGPLGGASLILAAVGAVLLSHSLMHVMHFVLAIPAGLAIAIAIYYPLVALIGD
jgi:hypothetical protein